MNHISLIAARWIVVNGQPFNLVKVVDGHTVKECSAPSVDEIVRFTFTEFAQPLSLRDAAGVRSILVALA